jgi:adenylate cyclase class 2
LKVFNLEHIWVIPFTTSGPEKYHYEVASLPKRSWAAISQFRTVSSKRLQRYIGRVDRNELAAIIQSLNNLIKNETPAIGGGISRPSTLESNNAHSINESLEKAIVDRNISCHNENMHEYEVKILDIDIAEIEKKLVAIGATKEGDYLYKSCVFDFPGFPLHNQSAWFRLRDEGGKVMLAYKRRLGVTSEFGNDEGMEEVQIEVSDYEKTKIILLKIGMIIKFEQEKKRTRYTKGGIEFDIDTWPRLNPLLEIEAKDYGQVNLGMKWLGIEASRAKKCSVMQVYDMNGIRELDYIKMTFAEFVKRPA